MARKRIRLIHWHADEARSRAAGLKAAGYVVDRDPFDGPAALKRMAAAPPDIVIVDLSRRPSHGRDVALALRQAKSTRRIPIVLADGDPEKVKRIRQLLPDATYTPWSRIKSAVKKALADPPADPVVPESALASYAGTPLPRKLGIKPGTVTALAGAPPDFEKTLGPLPEGAVLRRQVRGRCDLIVWFTRSRRELDRNLSRRIAAMPDRGKIWIAWPKKASGVASDLTQAVVRETGLAAGLVDFKICAIDATWSGLLFTRRK